MDTELIEKVLQGHRRAISRCISLIENDGAEAQAVMQALYPHTGQAHIVGVTGPPGTGKSTLVNELAKLYRTRGSTVGIIAVDPTSPFSGGAILGDRIRMRDVAGDPGIFIRSMATRGSLGGLARATADAIKVLDAAGYPIIFVETVGAGQAEVDIAKTAHTTIVVEAPGLGDDIQAIKAGIMEIADIFAVNKADREGVEHTVTALEMMLDMNHASRLARSGPEEKAIWRPPVCRTIAIRGEGVPELVEAIEAHRAYLRETGSLVERERARVEKEFRRLLEQRLMQRLLEQTPPQQLTELIERIAAREIDPYTAVEKLIGE